MRSCESFHSQSLADPTEGDKPYADIGLITELRKLANDAKGRWKVASAVSDEGLKWLSWPEYLECVKVLLDAGANVDKYHKRGMISIGKRITVSMVIGKKPVESRDGLYACGEH